MFSDGSIQKRTDIRAIVFFAIAALISASPGTASAEWLFSNPSTGKTADIANVYFADANRAELTVLRNGAIAGRVGAYVNLGTVLLPVNGLAAALNIPIRVDAENGIAKGTLPDGRAIMIIPGKNTVLVGGVEKKQVPNLIFLRNNEIYIDVSLFNDVFPFTAYLDQGAKLLRVSDKIGKAGNGEKPAPAATLPSEELITAEKPPVNTAVTPVTVRELNAPGTVPPPTAQPPPKPAPPAKQREPLVLQLNIDTITMQEFIDGFEQNGRLYLPLGQLISLLDFPITVDAKAGTAQGWFIKKENTFSLSETEAQVRGTPIKLPPGSLLSVDRDLYVDKTLLEQWFSLGISVDRYSMTLNITAHEPLPFEEKMRRDKARTALDQEKQAPAREATYKRIDYPYAAASVPFTDVTVNPSFQSQSNQVSSNYSILSVGDMGYMTSRLYASGNLADQAFSDVRFSMGRDDYGRRLLGPLHASSFSLGDVNTVSLSQVTQTGTGRGFALTNRALDRPDKFDVTSFVGDSTPGWQVELYRNGVLLDSQVVGTNGRYEFKDVPILFGNNTFRLAFFGPQGQVDEIVRNINAESSLLNKGEFTYNVSADQEANTLFGISNDSNPASTGIRSVGELEYGLSRWLTVTAGSAHTVLNDVEHTYATTGLRTSLAGILTGLDDAYDTTNNAHSTSLTMFANYFGTDLHFRQQFAQGFVSEENGATDVPVNMLTDLGFERQSTLPLLGALDAGLDAMRKDYSTGRIEDLWVNRLSKSIYGVSVTNALQYDHDNLGLDQLTGSMALRGFYDHVLLGGQIDYNAQPEAGINDVKLAGIYPISPGISGNTGIIVNMLGAQSVELDNTVTFDVDKYKLSFTVTDDTLGNFFAGITLNFSFGKVPGTNKWLFSSQNMAETGTVVARPYLDSNYNQQRDPDESAPSGVSLKIGSQTLKPDEDGMAIARSLPVNQPVGISMNLDKQENPFWTAAADEYRVVPRPGTPVVVDYPLFETSQVDGTVHTPSGSPSALVVELVNSEGQVVGTTHTTFDGYYLLQGVMPGTYTIRIAADSLAQRRLKQPEEHLLVIRKADFYTKDITLTP